MFFPAKTINTLFFDKHKKLGKFNLKKLGLKKNIITTYKSELLIITPFNYYIHFIKKKLFPLYVFPSNNHPNNGNIANKNTKVADIWGFILSLNRETFSFKQSPKLFGQNVNYLNKLSKNQVPKDFPLINQTIYKWLNNLQYLLFNNDFSNYDLMEFESSKNIRLLIGKRAILKRTTYDYVTQGKTAGERSKKFEHILEYCYTTYEKELMFIKLYLQIPKNETRLKIECFENFVNLFSKKILEDGTIKHLEKHQQKLTRFWFWMRKLTKKDDLNIKNAISNNNSKLMLNKLKTYDKKDIIFFNDNNIILSIANNIALKKASFFHQEPLDPQSFCASNLQNNPYIASAKQKSERFLHKLSVMANSDLLKKEWIDAQLYLQVTNYFNDWLQQGQSILLNQNKKLTQPALSAKNISLTEKKFYQIEKIVLPLYTYYSSQPLPQILSKIKLKDWQRLQYKSSHLYLMKKTVKINSPFLIKTLIPNLFLPHSKNIIIPLVCPSHFAYLLQRRIEAKKTIGWKETYQNACNKNYKYTTTRGILFYSALFEKINYLYLKPFKSSLKPQEFMLHGVIQPYLKKQLKQIIIKQQRKEYQNQLIQNEIARYKRREKEIIQGEILRHKQREKELNAIREQEKKLMASVDPLINFEMGWKIKRFASLFKNKSMLNSFYDRYFKIPEYYNNFGNDFANIKHELYMYKFNQPLFENNTISLIEDNNDEETQSTSSVSENTKYITSLPEPSDDYGEPTQINIHPRIVNEEYILNRIELIYSSLEENSDTDQDSPEYYDENPFGSSAEEIFAQTDSEDETTDIRNYGSHSSSFTPTTIDVNTPVDDVGDVNNNNNLTNENDQLTQRYLLLEKLKKKEKEDAMENEIIRNLLNNPPLNNLVIETGTNANTNNNYTGELVHNAVLWHHMASSAYADEAMKELTTTLLKYDLAKHENFSPEIWEKYYAICHTLALFDTMGLYKDKTPTINEANYCDSYLLKTAFRRRNVLSQLLEYPPETSLDTLLENQIIKQISFFKERLREIQRTTIYDDPQRPLFFRATHNMIKLHIIRLETGLTAIKESKTDPLMKNHFFQYLYTRIKERELEPRNLSNFFNNIWYKYFPQKKK